MSQSLASSKENDEEQPAVVAAATDSVPHSYSRLGILGWMFFDFAAQPFFTVVTSFIFGPYIVSRMVEDPVVGQSAFSLSIAIAGVVIALLSPVLGSIADSSGPRKPWLAVLAAIKALSLVCLWFSAPGSSLIWVLGLFILATACAEFSTVFNDSMMNFVVPYDEIGKVSSTAWGLGYIGGIVPLILILAFLAGSVETGTTLIGFDPLFGLDPEQGEDARVATPLTAAWYLLFTLPMFLFTPDRKSRNEKLVDSIRQGIVALKSTYLEARRRRGLFRFLIARMIYQDGVSALISLGGPFGASLFGWETIELGLFGIILNVVAIPSCFVAGRLDSKLGSKAIVLGSIVMLTIATLGVVSTGSDFAFFGLWKFSATADPDGIFSLPAEKCYIAFALFIGVALGPIQASSRAYLASSVGSDETGRYFGLYAFAGKATSFLAPLCVSGVTYITKSQRIGISCILIFFFVGFFVMRTTPTPAQNKQFATDSALNDHPDPDAAESPVEVEQSPEVRNSDGEFEF